MADVGGTSSSRTVFQIEDSATQVGDVPGTGTFVEIRCDLNSLQYTSDLAIDEGRTFCATQKDAGDENIGITLAGLFSGDTQRAYRLMKKAQRGKLKIGYRYGPEGDDTGDYGLSGIAIVGQIQIGAQVGQLQALNGTLGVDGQDHEFTWA